MDTITVLSLCSGVGGLDLGVKAVIPARTVCYVEREAFCTAVLVYQMQKGGLDTAPIWTDLQTFDGTSWTGVVDLVIAGFPCQPHSVAGKQKGPDDARWIWPDITRIISEVGPAFVCLENVPGLISSGLGAVLGSLAELGFDAEWCCVRASDVGAPHRRNRLFILAYRNCELLDTISDTHSDPVRDQCGGSSGEGRDETPQHRIHGQPWPAPFGEKQFGWEPPRTQPSLGRGAHGPSVRVDRLRAIGNAVVPQQAAYALMTLLRRAHM